MSRGSPESCACAPSPRRACPEDVRTLPLRLLAPRCAAPGPVPAAGLKESQVSLFLPNANKKTSTNTVYQATETSIQSRWSFSVGFPLGGRSGRERSSCFSSSEPTPCMHFRPCSVPLPEECTSCGTRSQ
ncbi:zinc finger protein 770 isoform X2 [Ovis aries]|uniref:zinc finger protein 770 isoform X2 n=1 Tax=Ovis aries TaxID=9940 RepID=UPI0029527D95|nr:zinc finger protein 770 isoform X2 [Ovis aries]